MDPIEDKLGAFYKKRKTLIERSTPDFDTFWSKLEHARTVKRPNWLLRIAASVGFIVAATLLYYFYNADHPATENVQLSAANMAVALPSQVLLDQSPQLIWEWKAPTDRLLENVNISIESKK